MTAPADTPAETASPADTDAPSFAGARLLRADFTGATLLRAKLRGATVRWSDLTGLTVRECDVDGLEIDSHDLFFGSLVVNGVDVVPLVDAELNRRFPGRELQSSTEPEGLRASWEAVQRAWTETVESTPPEQRDASVGGEWSLAQTLRHLVLAADAWLGAAIEERERPFHPIGQVFTGAAEMGLDTSIFREPTDFDEILAVRAERQQRVAEALARATPELLDEPRRNPWDPDGEWRPMVGDCLRVILEEEWAHLRCIRRDLATLRGGAE
ncbi:MAG: DinB family protein [Microbacteriaceae bacterium]|nr:DinB family protein [Microbacteriaceae bacterium]